MNVGFNELSEFCNSPNVLTNTVEQQREILLLQLIEMQKLLPSCLHVNSDASENHLRFQVNRSPFQTLNSFQL